MDESFAQAVGPAGLDAALARGVVAPSADDGTYRVDPFVAVLLYERLRVDLTPFAWVEAADPAPAGYRVGPLGTGDILVELGLREGDVVEALNRVPIHDMASLELALDAAENRLTVTIFREDLSFTNSYRFEGGLAWREVIAGEQSVDEPSTDESPTDAPPLVVEAEDDTPTQPSSRAPTPPSKRASPGQRAKSSPSPKTPRSPSPGPTHSNIRCVGSASCTITKRAFDDLRASPSKLQSGVDVVPAIRNDVFSGYKLQRVSSGSPVHALGFRAGDKITHVNGRDLTDDAQAMALYWSLGSSKLFKVRYERGGRKLVKTIRVV